MARILAALFLLVLAIVVLFTAPVNEATADELSAKHACCPTIISE